MKPHIMDSEWIEDFGPGLEGMLNCCMIAMDEAIEEALQGFSRAGLPAGATIEFEMSVRRRQHSFG